MLRMMVGVPATLQSRKRGSEIFVFANR